MDDIINDLASKVKSDVMVFCSKVAAMHAGADKSDEYNKAAREIAAKILELNGPSKSVRAA